MSTRPHRPRARFWDVQAFLEELSARPDLVDKDAGVDPAECRVLTRFHCDEESWDSPEFLGIAPGDGLAVSRLVHRGLVQRRDDGSLRLTGEGHRAEHAFLETHWPKLRPPAVLGCGRCGVGHEVLLG